LHLNGDRAWYQNGVLHCVTGPAVIYATGEREWWVAGVQQ